MFIPTLHTKNGKSSYPSRSYMRKITDWYKAQYKSFNMYGNVYFKYGDIFSIDTYIVVKGVDLTLPHISTASRLADQYSDLDKDGNFPLRIKNKEFTIIGCGQWAILTDSWKAEPDNDVVIRKKRPHM